MWTCSFGKDPVQLSASNVEQTVHSRYNLESERRLALELIDSLKQGDILYDVGAGFGFHSVTAATTGAEVVAFEPETDRQAVISTNAERNDVTMTVDPSLLGKGDGETVRGDDLADEYGKATVLKIDVEGMELDVLKGFREQLNDSIRHVFVEVHPDLGSFSHGDVEKFLEDHGYSVSSLGDRGTQYHITASRASL